MADSRAPQNAIEFRDVSYSYDGETLALNGLSLTVPQGSFVALVGSNGSGKSTAARHMNALFAPDSGSVHVAGEVISATAVASAETSRKTTSTVTDSGSVALPEIAPNAPVVAMPTAPVSAVAPATSDNAAATNTTSTSSTNTVAVSCDVVPAATPDILAVRSACGMVFQNPDDQAVASIVEDDVAFGPENLGVPTDDIRGTVDSALENVGMLTHASKEIAALSGGQKQRVAVAGTLAMHPQIIVFDESTAMLDPRGRRGIERVVREQHERGMTVVLITHRMEEIAQANLIYVLDHGAVVLSGTPSELFTQPDNLARFKELGLELPFAVSLASKLRARGLDLPPVLTEREVVSTLCQLHSRM